MRISKLIGGAALGGLLLAGVAYAAVNTTNPALPKTASDGGNFSATWAMGPASLEAITADVTSADVTATITTGTSIDKMKADVVLNDKQGNTATGSSFYLKAPTSAGKDDNAYVQYTVTPAEGKTLTITNMALDISSMNSGDSRIQVYVVTPQGETELTNGAFYPGRSDKSYDIDSFRQSYDITGVENIAGPVSLKVYLEVSKDQTSARHFGFANVVITGSVASEGGDTPVDPDPVDPDPVEVEVPEGWAAVPGTLLPVSETNWSCSGAYKIENADSDNPNFGSIKTSAKLATDFVCTEAGAYAMDYNFTWNKAGYTTYITFEVVDMATGATEASTVYTFTDKGQATIPLKGTITTGKKTLKISFDDQGHGQYVTNFAAPTFSKVGTCYSEIAGVTAQGTEVAELEGYDWAINIPAGYQDENVVLAVDALNGAVTAGDYTVNGSDVTIPVPAAGEAVVVPLTLVPAQGAYAPKTDYSVRVYHIGGVAVTGVTVNGKSLATTELLDALNGDEGTAAITGRVYTAVPQVAVTFADGTTPEITTSLEGTDLVCAFAGTSVLGDKSFTLTIEGIHTFTPAENDKTVTLRYDGTYNQADGSWSNGLYTLRNSNDGWNGTQFKFKPGTHSWNFPSNVVVKQFKFMQLGDNYAPGKVTAVTSEGATCYLPTDSEFTNGDANRYDLVVNIEGHQAGTPVEFTFEGNQPVAWFEFVIEELPLTGTPELTGAVTTPEMPLTQNHCVVKLSFDRAMADCVATYGNGYTAKANGGSATLTFLLWNLDWNTQNPFTIAQGDLKDIDGNAYPQPLTFEIEVGQPAAVNPLAAENVTICETADDFRAAITSANSTNNKADAPRRVIFLKNGDYDLGSGEGAALLHLNKAYNVSIIGESRDGVMIHGDVSGISYPVFSTRYSTGTYMENFTIRNDRDYGTSATTIQAVAHYGGIKETLVNVRLLGNQDTEVTTESAYYLNCELHGCTDYVCGGGNIFFDHCTFVMTRSGGVIAAPNTSAATQWGYVFSDCVIKGEGQYSLGRPWQNEPRCYWINTTMETLPTDAGWRNMSELVTHFYEYGSKDKDGNLLDLSKRQNSPTSLNTYTPVLTAEEAAEFTVENVLGAPDSWYAPGEYELLDAPVATYDLDEKAVSWNVNTRAAGYMVYHQGEIATYLPGDEYLYNLPAVSTLAADDTYTVRAMSQNGTLSEHSAPVAPSGTVGVDAVSAEADAEGAVYYNAQGLRVSPAYSGVVIKVAADGTVTKTVKL